MFYARLVLVSTRAPGTRACWEERGEPHGSVPIWLNALMSNRRKPGRFGLDCRLEFLEHREVLHIPGDQVRAVDLGCGSNQVVDRRGIRVAPSECAGPLASPGCDIGGGF